MLVNYTINNFTPSPSSQSVFSLIAGSQPRKGYLVKTATSFGHVWALRLWISNICFPPSYQLLLGLSNLPSYTIICFFCQGFKVYLSSKYVKYFCSIVRTQVFLKVNVVKDTYDIIMVLELHSLWVFELPNAA